MIAHPAGPRHAEEVHPAAAPPKPQTPQELLQLPSNVWPHNASRGDGGEVRVASVRVSDLAREFGTPLFVIDEDDFRARCRAMVDAFGGGHNVHYASKAFLCTEIARWIAEEGLSLD
ncbi:MAG TPA: diaminopimelate decarboxylase, partial [Mycobacterium sp.]|nr:diaminopimelate decarboxylase [Mycobacterium sp.]